MDVHNQKLVANVHPPDWVNPVPTGRYNLVVIGGGTAGLVAAGGAALLGGKVALIERDLLGGDCLNAGCVPSKTLIRSARAMADVQGAHQFGIRVPSGSEVDFGAVMERLRRVRAEISPHDSAQQFKDWGADVFLGEARFSGPDTVIVGGTTLRFKKAVIATGARASRPDIPGLKAVGFLTNETVFSLTERPRRLAIVGGGPIGCELAQAFARLGSEVVMIHKRDHLLGREDPDAVSLIESALKRDGIRLVLKAELLSVERTPGGKCLRVTSGGQEESLEVDEILVASGRTPNTEGLGLESANVRYDSKKGVEVNDFLQTTNPNIYACGDICMEWKFTHAADAAARIAIQNALFLGRQKLSALTMPWCTYTDPEVARVGLIESEALERGIAVETLQVPLTESDRALADGETEGFLKLYLKAGTDKIVGGTLVARHAGEMINEITLAMVAGLGLGKLARVIYPYPTQAEVIRKAVGDYQLKGLQRYRPVLEQWLSWTR